MKKFFMVLVALFFMVPANAYIIDNTKEGKTEALIGEIGYKILNSNRIPYRVAFMTKKCKEPNAFSTYRAGAVYVCDSLVKYSQDENEVAAVLAHEISHAVDYRQGIFRGYFTYLSVNTKRNEYKADKRGVDYMVKAGYNPLGMILLLNRIAPEERYDWCSTHPLASRRLAEVYEYIYLKYPQYLVQNEYKNNMIYQNFLLTSRENRQKLEENIKNNSKRKVKYL